MIAAATTATAKIPVLKARREPTSAKCRGMKRSFASTDARRGKPVKPVFAASKRMTAVVSCTKRWNGEPPPTIARVVMLFTVSISLASGCMPIRVARNVKPRKIVAKIEPIRTSVMTAFRVSGGRKLGTPFATASLPVRPTDPDAVGVDIGDEARDRGDARGGRDRDREDVVDEQRRSGDESGDDAVVFAGHQIAAAAVRVRADDARLR